MKKDMKKTLTTVACIGVAVAIIGVIGIFMKKPPMTELPLQTNKEETTSKPQNDVTVIAPKVDSVPQSSSEQQIQEDAKKPTEPQAPSLPEDADKNNPDSAPSYPPDSKPESKPSGGLPGFGDVPDGGANDVIIADDMYENGNKIGDM